MTKIPQNKILKVIVVIEFLLLLIILGCGSCSKNAEVKTSGTYSVTLYKCSIKTGTVRSFLKDVVLSEIDRHYTPPNKYFFYIEKYKENLWIASLAFDECFFFIDSGFGWFEFDNYQFIVNADTKNHFKFTQQPYLFEYKFIETDELSIIEYDDWNLELNG